MAPGVWNLMRLRLRVLLPWIAAVAALSAGAGAQEPGDDLIERGIELRVEHKDREALEQFKKAYEARPTARALAQIGLAEQALGSWGDAEKHLGEALKASTDPWIAKNRELLAESLRVVAAHLGSLEIECPTAGAELFVNGAKVGELPLQAPVRLDAGTAVVEVRKRGFVTVRRPVEIAAGAVARERVVLVQDMAAPQPLAPVPAPSVATAPAASRAAAPRASTPVAAYVVGGVGIVGLAIAGTFGGLALSKKGQLSSSCLDAGACGSPADKDANAAAHRYALIADVGAAVGVVGLGVGIWLALSGPKRPESRERTTGWQPLLGPGIAGMGWKSAF
jgi:hypothetical protein